MAISGLDTYISLSYLLSGPEYINRTKTEKENNSLKIFFHAVPRIEEELFRKLLSS